MALTPTDNQAFLREVDDNLRRDQITGLFTRWGKLLIVLVGLCLLALALFLWWQSRRTAQAETQGEQLSQALTLLEQGQAARADPLLATLAADGGAGYRASARLAQAASAAVRNDPKAAARDYDAIATDAGLPQAVRDVALLRSVAVQFDTLPPQSVVDRLRPLAGGSGPWHGSAGELTAAAYLKMNRRDLAGPLLAGIARDPGVPQSLRGRVAGLAAALGQTVAPIGPVTVTKD